MVTRRVTSRVTASTTRRVTGNGVSGGSFTPLQIPGLAIWHDLVDGSSLLASVDPDVLASEAGNVAKVLDSSGNSNHATNATNLPRKLENGLHSSSNQALNYSGTALGLLNNVPGVTFAAVVHFFQKPGTTAIAFGFSTNGSATVARFSFGAGRSSGKYFLGGRRLDADSFVDIDSPDDLIVNRPVLVVGVIDYASGSGVLRINKAEVVANASMFSTGNTQASDSLDASAFQFSTTITFSQWYQLALWPRALTSQEISLLENGWEKQFVPTVFGTDYLLEDTIWNQWINPLSVSLGGVTYVVGISRDGVIRIEGVNESTGVVSSFDLDDITGDDHNAAALVLSSTKPWFVFYANHGTDTSLRYRKTSTGILNWEEKQTITTPDSCTYAQAYRCHDGTDADGRVMCFFRQRPNWGYVYSDDEGATWSSTQNWITSSVSNHLYHQTKMKTDGQTLCVALHEHPVTGDTQDVYYCEINLQTGDITRPDTGEVLGDLYTSGDLPIDFTDCMKVYDATGTTRTRLLDVSASGEVLVARWPGDYNRDNATIHYHLRDGSNWGDVQVCGAGTLLQADGNQRAYIGGGFFGNTAGEVYISTDEGSEGFWEIRKYTILGSLVSFAKVNQRKYPAKRFRPVVPVNASAEYPVLWCEGSYETFTKYDANVVYETP